LILQIQIGRTRERGEISPWARVPARLPGEDAVLELNVGAAPMVLGGDGDQDKMQKVMKGSKSWSVMTWASRGDVKPWLESRGGSVVLGSLDLLRDKAKGKHQRVRRVGGGRLGGERGHGDHRGR
jgi:hypothetical protein